MTAPCIHPWPAAGPERREALARQMTSLAPRHTILFQVLHAQAHRLPALPRAARTHIHTQAVVSALPCAAALRRQWAACAPPLWSSLPLLHGLPFLCLQTQMAPVGLRSLIPAASSLGAEHSWAGQLVAVQLGSGAAGASATGARPVVFRHACRFRCYHANRLLIGMQYAPALLA